MILNSINVKEILDEELKSLPPFLKPKGNVVIAGGFAAYIYYKLNEKISGKDLKINETYTDLDYFRLGNVSGSELDFLFSEYENVHSMRICAGAESLEFSRDSKHANSFILDEERKDYKKRFHKPIQGVKYRYDSVRDMFKSFDLHNSQAAIIGNELVYSEDFARATDNFTVSCANKGFFSENHSDQTIMFQFNRVYKYLFLMRNINTDHGKSKLCKYLSDRLLSFLLKIAETEESYWNRTNTYTNLYYGRRDVCQSTESKVYQRFSFGLLEFFNSLSSSEQKIMFLIESKNKSIKKASLSYIDPKTIEILPF